MHGAVRPPADHSLEIAARVIAAAVAPERDLFHAAAARPQAEPLEHDAVL